MVFWRKNTWAWDPSRVTTAPLQAFEDIAAEADERKRGIHDEGVISAVQAAVWDNLSWKLDTVSWPDKLLEDSPQVWEESEKIEWPYIDDNTTLIIPPHLTLQFPFFAFAQWSNQIKISDIAWMQTDARLTAIRLLAWSQVTIFNGEDSHIIRLNERIIIWDGEGSLNDYLRSPHQTYLKELD